VQGAQAGLKQKLS